MKCNMDPSINRCQFYDCQSGCCSNTGSCSFQDSPAEKAPERVLPKAEYIRKERWYEKYYQNKDNRKAKHHRIWQCYAPVGDATDGPIQRALAAIEQLPDLPENFEIVEIKYKFSWGIRVDFRNAGNCVQRVQAILKRLSEETRNAL